MFVNEPGWRPRIRCEFLDCHREHVCDVPPGGFAGDMTELTVRDDAAAEDWQVVLGKDYCERHAPMARLVAERGAGMHLVSESVASVTVVSVACSHPGCPGSATVAGDVKGVFLIGWGANQAETQIFCPRHHPQGPEQVLLQAQATGLFLAIADRCDEVGDHHDPEVLRAMLELRQRLFPDEDVENLAEADRERARTIS